jgi:biopolymer transport protein ExbD
MAMTSGDGSGFGSQINVTPLIDVLLVLLIIFMVIVPVTPKGLSAAVPQAPNSHTPDTATDTIVVSVLKTAGAQPEYRINQDLVAKGDLLARLTAIYQNRAQRTMFVKGDGDMNFAQIAEVIDVGHLAGADNIGLLTPHIQVKQ